MKRTYVIARKNVTAPDREWLEKLQRIPGVRLRSGTADQAVIVADDREIALLRTEVGDEFIIEEQMRRTTERS